MKKTFLALVLAAGLTSFAGNAIADTNGGLITTFDSYAGGTQTIASWSFTGGFLTTGFTNSYTGGFSAINVGSLGIPPSLFNNLTNTFSTNPLTATPIAISGGGTMNDITTGKSITFSYITPFVTVFSGHYALNLIAGSYSGSGPLTESLNINSNDVLSYTPGTGDFFVLNTPFTQFSNTDQKRPGSGYLTGGTQETVITTAVPEPSTYALFGIGAIGMLLVMRRKKTA